MTATYTYKTVQSQLRMLFYILSVLALAIVALFECGIIPKGFLPQESNTLYLLQMCSVAITIVLIPIALKAFTRLMTSTAKEKDDNIFYRKYRRNSAMRLTLTYIVSVSNLLIHYATSDNSALYCALVGALCFIYSYPTRSTVEQYSGMPDSVEQ